jgi:hypothetical protein
MGGIIGAIFRKVGLLLGLVKAKIDDHNDELLENPTLIREEGKKAADELKASYKQIYDVTASKVNTRTEKEARVRSNTARLSLLALALKGDIRAEGKDTIEKMGFQYTQLMQAKSNATRQMQARAKVLKITSLDDPTATADHEFQHHKDALANFIGQEKELRDQLTAIETDLKGSIDEDTAAIRKINSDLIGLKTKLASKRREVENLPGKIEDIITDILGAKEAKRADEMLRSISTSNADARMANLDRLHKKALSETAVANEMTGSPISSEYLTGYDQSATNDEIENLLNPNKGSEDTKIIESPVSQSEELPNG